MSSMRIFAYASVLRTQYRQSSRLTEPYIPRALLYSVRSTNKVLVRSRSCDATNMTPPIQKRRYPMIGRILCTLWLFPLFVFAADSLAGSEPEYVIKISHHQFVPAELHIPTGIKVRIVLDNQDDTAEEFDSHSLNREKHVQPKSQAVIFIGPLAPGRYVYEGESEVAGGAALGVIVVE